MTRSPDPGRATTERARSSPSRRRPLIVVLGAAILVGPVGSASALASRHAQSPTVAAGAGKTYTFSSTRQGTAHGGTWKDDRSSILQADGSGKVAFPLFVFNSPGFGDMDYTGQFLIESGNEDRYAGFV